MMLKKTTFGLIGLLSAIILSSTLFGTTLASNYWAVTDNANTKENRITTLAPSVKRLTYCLPSGTNGEFTENYVDVEEGADLYTTLNSHTSNIGNYHFVEWHWSNNKFASYNDGNEDDIVSNTQKVNSDLKVYAKYVQSNVLYYWDGDNRYITSSTSNVVINADRVFYGDQIYSYNGVDGVEKYLYADSGRYSFTKNTDSWTIKRVIEVNVANVNWWTSASARHILWCFDHKDSGADAWSSTFTISSNVGQVEVDYLYNGFILVRLDSGSSINWDAKWNQSTNIYLNWGKDDTTYNSTTSRISLTGGKDGDNYECKWVNH